jgi:hypothetical protein
MEKVSSFQASDNLKKKHVDLNNVFNEKLAIIELVCHKSTENM